jgi:hypothetical protein
MPDIRPVTVSTLLVQTSSIIATTALVGTASSFSALEFYGLFGNYNNTAIAEISTGAGTQELLFFKGSSINDRIRFTTTGEIRFEPQVASQLFSNNPALATPTMILQSNLVGIGTAAPGSLLDVAGQGRFQIVSTQVLNLSSILGNPATAILYTSNLTSTVQGLGSASYVSTASLVSTTQALLNQTQTAGYLSTPNLTSTVQGLGSSGYISSFFNVLSISSQQIITSSIGVGCNSPSFQLDVLGTARASLVSTPAALTSSFFGNLADAQTVILYEI